MIYYKSAADLEGIKKSAELLSRVHGEIAKLIVEGVTTKELDKRAEEFIRDHGAVPSFYNYNGYPASLCISVNETVVHGIPSNYRLKSGDIVSIDCGVYMNGYHADCAYTYPVGEVSAHVMELLKVTKQALYEGIAQVAPGKRIGDIGYAIQSYVQARGFSVVRELVGHGVGKNLHEDPQVPNYGKRGTGAKIQNGMVIAIEPMINMGKREVVHEADGWTIRTKDRKPSAHFEHTVALYNNKTEILTTFQYIEQIFKF
ncbi:MAG: type I methionyl aminopeptidase [Cytophagales bacterium]|nr:type I methionyl aminopeptidase [Bernardetiaceae bacterium]MDW8209903.1 type I methionyl aminopeptidase [Cytophagales bacterium]